MRPDLPLKINRTLGDYPGLTQCNSHEVHLLPYKAQTTNAIPTVNSN